jgi:hypothetical protein
MSRSFVGLASVLGLFLVLAGFLCWAVLAGGYPAGVVIPAVVVAGVLVAGMRAVRAEARQPRGPNEAPTSGTSPSAWGLAMFVLGTLTGWLCGELIGFVLLPVLAALVVPRARKRGLLSVTLPPFGLGLVILPLFFLVIDLSEGGGWPIVLWFIPELVIGLLLILPWFRHSRGPSISSQGAR